MKKYRLIDPKNDSDVLGGPVGEDNALLLRLAPIKDSHWRVLNIGEECYVQAMTSAREGNDTYRIIRTE